jgi:hypothetical protein
VCVPHPAIFQTDIFPGEFRKYPLDGENDLMCVCVTH